MLPEYMASFIKQTKKIPHIKIVFCICSDYLCLILKCTVVNSLKHSNMTKQKICLWIFTALWLFYLFIYYNDKND